MRSRSGPGRHSAPQLALLALVAGVFACLTTLAPYELVGVPLVVGAYSVGVAGNRLSSAASAVIVLAAAAGGVALYVDEGAEWRDAVTAWSSCSR